ncbi:hypothetical protein ACFPA8_01870 [Streptomyces ovatisporus]|uniref:Uncharacterized protein n=1 Tax=Streptomyces ovatisporus TaxID=1128682 RepID=A0ABV9A2K8_9ACTN
MAEEAPPALVVGGTGMPAAVVRGVRLDALDREPARQAVAERS